MNVTSPRPESPPSAAPIAFHPDFDTSDADIVLVPKCATCRFRIHSHILKLTSGFFRAMFSLPQSQSSNNPDDIYLDEEAHILVHLFRMTSGLVLLPIDSYDLLDAIIYAAEKYDMPGPMSIMRVLVMTPPFLRDPLRLYTVASRHGWTDETKFASTQTLSLNIFDHSLRLCLQRLSSTALLDLILLHRSRKEILQEQLDHPPFVPGGSATCVQCGGAVDYRTWRELKYRIIMEMDHRPLADTIQNPGLDQWSEAVDCWEAKCPNVECGRYLYDKMETLRVIHECIERLPKSV
ncbi:hypothetical protein BDQ17DRAFT_1016692 [Cyathus striatus]|nr:hypothetical protein BDQ17DRAFT_1016692 [Cyathus striatus]